VQSEGPELYMMQRAGLAEMVPVWWKLEYQPGRCYSSPNMTGQVL